MRDASRLLSIFTLLTLTGDSKPGAVGAYAHLTGSLLSVGSCWDHLTFLLLLLYFFFFVLRGQLS